MKSFATTFIEAHCSENGFNRECTLSHAGDCFPLFSPVKSSLHWMYCLIFSQILQSIVFAVLLVGNEISFNKKLKYDYGHTL